MIEQQKSNKLSKEKIIKLIMTKNSIEWDYKFVSMKGKARQLGMLWKELANELGFGCTGLEIKNEYNLWSGSPSEW